MSLGVKLKLEHVFARPIRELHSNTSGHVPADDSLDLKLGKAYVLSHLPKLNMRPGTTKIPAAGSNIKANSQRTAGRRNNRQRRSLILRIELAALGMAKGSP
ncbi:hypothetical protein T09_11498 [Trichinella sp. T9]|nr:hypothetical protein T09_11498 [Trichinella sp. T9]